MNAPDKLPPETRQPVSGYLWGALAVLTCPCHLPILAAVLAGTTAGAFLGEHWGVAALALTGLFVLAVTRLPSGADHDEFAARRMDGGRVGAGGGARTA